MKTVQTFLKSSIKILLLIFLSGSTLLCSAQENVKSLTFYSKSLNKDRKVEVCLPEDYNENESVRYPVIYFLHGTAQNSFSEGNIHYFLKKLISSKTISPVIMVKPDGSCSPWGDSYFMNSALNGNFEDYLVNDLVEYIDSAYRTIASRDKRAIMGYSAGGSDAMRTALKHPEIYCGVVSHNGRLNMSSHSLYIPGILSENGGAPVASFSPNAGPMSRAGFTMAGAFSPNMNNPPYFVDFPFDDNGNFDDSIWNRWLLNDCSFLAKNISKEDDLAIYFDCGTYDEEATYPFNTSFADSLDIIGLPYNFQSYSGGHYDRDSRYPIGLTFLDSVMNKKGSKIERGVWTYKAAMPTARCFLGACVLDGKIYAIGGATSPLAVSSVLEVYDPLTDTWVQKANMPLALCYPNVCAINGKIYVFGGASAVFGKILTDSFVYDPQSDEWKQIDASPHDYGGSITAVVNNKVFLIGGTAEGTGIPVADVNVFDPISETWSKKTGMPTARSLHTACVFDNKIYCMGGTSKSWDTNFYQKVEVYDPLQDTWTIKNDMPLGRWGLSACQLDNLIFVTGGFDGQNSCDRLDILNPITNEWITGTQMHQIRRAHTTCVLDGKIYVLGGSYTNEGAPAILSSVEVYSVNVPANNSR